MFSTYVYFQFQHVTSQMTNMESSSCSRKKKTGKVEKKSNGEIKKNLRFGKDPILYV